MRKLIGLSAVIIILIGVVDADVVSNLTDRYAVESEVCLEKVAKLDKCLPKLVVYGDRSFDPPRTEDQLDKHCLLLDDNLKCVSSYSRQCLPPFARNMYSVMTRRLKTQFAKRCKAKEGRRDFINLMACADQKYMEPAHRCMDAFVAHLEAINTMGEESQNRQIELVCCTFQLFQECIFNASKKLKCSSRVFTSDQVVEYVKSIINSMGGDLMDFMCGKYDKVSSCIQGYPKTMRQLTEISEKVINGTMKARYNSPLRPMLQIFINFQQ